MSALVTTEDSNALVQDLRKLWHATVAEFDTAAKLAMFIRLVGAAANSIDDSWAIFLKRMQPQSCATHVAVERCTSIGDAAEGCLEMLAIVHEMGRTIVELGDDINRLERQAGERLREIRTAAKVIKNQIERVENEELDFDAIAAGEAEAAAGKVIPWNKARGVADQEQLGKLKATDGVLYQPGRVGDRIYKSSRYRARGQGRDIRLH